MVLIQRDMDSILKVSLPIECMLSVQVSSVAVRQRIEALHILPQGSTKFQTIE